MISLLHIYKEQFNKYPDYADKTRDAEKANRLFFKLRGAFKIEGTSEFVSEIERELKYLMAWKAGRVLIKKIIKADKEIIIKEGNESQHIKTDGHIEIEKPNPKMSDYYCSANEKGEIRLVKYADPSIGLAHELLHKNNARERSSRYLGGVTSGLFNPWFSNMEEQIVITGLDTSNNIMVYTPLNESLFLALAGSTLRVNHLCLEVPINEFPSYSDCATLNAWVSIKEMKEIDISSR